MKKELIGFAELLMEKRKAEELRLSKMTSEEIALEKEIERQNRLWLTKYIFGIITNNMMNFISKITVGVLTKIRRISLSRTCTQDHRCCVCEPIKSIIPPSPSQIKMAIKKCPNYSGN